MLAVLEYLEPIAGQVGLAEAELLVEIGEERQLLAALVIAVLFLAAWRAPGDRPGLAGSSTQQFRSSGKAYRNHPWRAPD